MAEPILIWGAGAIGGTLGAYWTQAGIDVLMVDIDAEHATVCSTQGLTIRGPVDNFTQVVPTVTPEQLTGKFSRCILAVKAHHTAPAVEQLAAHLAEDGFVMSAQNGLNEITLSRLLSEQQTMGCFVNFGADWHGPGEILLGNRGAVVVGELDGRVRDRTREMFELLKLFEPDAVLTENIWSYLWGKLGYGAMLFGTALTNDSMTENFADPARTKIWVTLGKEVMAVAHSQGVVPKGFNGFVPAAFMPDAPADMAQRSIDNLAEFNRHTAKTHSGIWRDLAVRKRETEVDEQIAIIADIGNDVGIDTPALRCLVELVHDVEKGRREQSNATLQQLADVCS
jgi:2-dehydropantoate 2-reductase